MKKLIGCTLSAIVVAVLVLGVLPASAGKPQTDSVFNGNGYPSGPHFNLLIHGKPVEFTCPALTNYFQVTVLGDWSCTNDSSSKPVNNGEYVGSCSKISCLDCEETSQTPICTETNVPNYGNVVNMPRFATSDPITIVMESGRTGPKSQTQPAATTLMVTDWCTESFPDYGVLLGDEARILLPKNPSGLGYAVYAEVLGKPAKNGDGPAFVMVPTGFELIQNEYFVNLDSDADLELLLLGFISPDGIFNPGGGPIELKRSGGTRKTATDISALFKWEGNICYVQGVETEEATFCEDGEGTCVATNLCCKDTTDPADGIYDVCKLQTVDEDGNPVACAEDEDLISGACKYIQNDWVFNIADFVNVLWNVPQNEDVYNVQIRFYPLPLNEEP